MALDTKITWQKAAIILILILASAGAVTYTDLFGTLFQLKGISYTYTGNISCGSECESYINVTTDYWRVCFEHPSDNQRIYIPGQSVLERTSIGENSDTVLYKKSNYGRTLWVNLNSVENVVTAAPDVPVDWLVPTYGGNWRPVQDGDCWDRGKVNKIKLVGHKEEWQTVEWSLLLGDYVDIDPEWAGTPTKIVEEEFSHYEERSLNPLGDNFSDYCYYNEKEEYVCPEKINESVTISREYWLYENEDYALKIPEDVKCVANNGPDAPLDCSLDVFITYKTANSLLTYNDIGTELVFTNTETSPASYDTVFVDNNAQAAQVTAKDVFATGFDSDGVEKPSHTLIRQGNHTITFDFQYDQWKQDKINVSVFDQVIDPVISGCMLINSSGEYTMDGDLTGLTTSQCISINDTVTDVLIDCQGYTLDANDVADYGIYADYVTEIDNANITIQNCPAIQDWDTAAIYFNDVGGLVMKNFSLTSLTDSGIILTDSDVVNISDFSMTNTVASDSVTSVSDIGIQANSFHSLTVTNGTITRFQAGLDTDGILTGGVSNFSYLDIDDSKPFDIFASAASSGAEVAYYSNINGSVNDKPTLVFSGSKDDNQVINHTDWSQLVTNRADNILIENITYDGQSQAVLLSQEGRWELRNNQFTDMAIIEDDGYDSLWVNNTFTQTSSPFLYLFYLYLDRNAFHFYNNTVDLYAANQDWNSATFRGYVRIDGNSFYTNSAEFITTDSWSDNWVISNNLFNLTASNDYFNLDPDSSLLYLNKSFTTEARPSFMPGDDPGTTGGNFYAYTDGSGFSETCDDVDADGYCDTDFTEDGYTDYLTYSDEFALSQHPRWSLNSTNSTVAGENVTFSVFWNATDDAGSMMDSYVFSWHNGVNWTNYSLSVDLEDAIQSEIGLDTVPTEGVTILETFDDVSNWTGSSNCWQIGASTGSSGTGPQSGDSDDAGTYFLFVETSSFYCYTLGDTSYVTFDVPIDWDVGTSDNITFETNFYGTEIGTMTLEENSSGSWEALTYSESGDDGNSGIVWTAQLEDTSALTGVGQIRFKYVAAGGFHGDAAIDKFQVTSIGASGLPDNETNKTAILYEDVGLVTYLSVSQLDFVVQVDYYNTSGSIERGNTNATLWLEAYNGTDWVDGGDFSVNETGNFSISVTEPTVLSAWNTTTNQDFRISARYIDYNDSNNYDNITWSGVWVNQSSQQFFLDDSAVKFTVDDCNTANTTCWSNVSKVLTVTGGANISWYVWANTSFAARYNTTDIFSFLTTGGASSVALSLYVWNGADWIDETSGAISFRCTPTQTDCEPTNQDVGASQCIYNVTNTDSSTASEIQFKIDPVIANIDLKVDDDYTSSGAMTLTDTFATITTTTFAPGDSLVYCAWADYSNPTSGGYFNVSVSGIPE